MKRDCDNCDNLVLEMADCYCILPSCRHKRGLVKIYRGPKIMLYTLFEKECPYWKLDPKHKLTPLERLAHRLNEQT